MKQDLNKNIKAQIQVLAYYQILGGVMGIGLIVWLGFQSNIFLSLGLLILLFVIGLYSFSIYCGYNLLNYTNRESFRLSAINQALQILSFMLLGFSYKYIAGVEFAVGVNLTNEALFTFDFSFFTSEFQMNLNTEKETTKIAINIIPILIMYFIGKLEQKVETGEPIPTIEESNILDSF
ncbi:hypothetical protein WAF17_01020 [Bernardetia sp. ABR2-2B]|uniref:hypothetical protein n=1 Tax=Bernardetia sp. ABR2-2B TaxID=3127472 RepID=UPI0030CB6A08